MAANDQCAQDPNELFDILTYDGRPTGETKPRALVHRDGDWHRALHVWITGLDEQGEPFLMFQRRSASKDTWPNHFDTTVGGHVRAGETLQETLREVEEEIGISAEGLILRPLGMRIAIGEGESGIRDRELQEVFLLRDDRPLTAYRPNPHELAALARFSLCDLLPFFAGETACVRGVSLAAEAANVLPITVHQQEFIPKIDRYNLRVAIAAANALRGDRYISI